MTDEPTFDSDPDWRFPLRVGLPPGSVGGAVLDDVVAAPAGVLLRRIRLGVDGLDCDIAIAQTTSELELLGAAVTFSANLVVMLGHSAEEVDPAAAVDAAHAMGAVGYVIAAFSADRLSLFVRQLAEGATVEEGLVRCGPHTLVGDPDALAVSPRYAFLAGLATIDAPEVELEVMEPPPPVTRGRPRGVPRGVDRFPSRGVYRSSREVEAALRDLAGGFGNDDAGNDPMAARAGALVTAALRGDQAITDGLDRRRAGPAGVSRFLQVALHRRQRDGAPGPRIGYGFLRNQPMVLLVGIGPLGPTRLVADVALDERQLGRPGPDGWDLEVIVKPDVGEIVRRPLQLPANGPSADVPFPIDVDPAADQWRGRITVLHQSRAVQSAILTGPVIDADGDPGTGGRPSLVIDGEFHPLARLDEQSAGGVTIELDTNPAVYAECGDFLIEPRENESRNASNRIAAKLGEMAVELDEAPDLNGPQARSLLKYLAVQGSLLLRSLFPNQVQREAVTGERFLQVLRLSDAAPELPFEFVYELPSPPDDFELCTQWTDGIADGRCPRCHAAGADNRSTLCPLGFWGLNRVIERHNAVGAAETRAQARLRRGDIAGRTPVQLKRAVFALSAKADKAPRGAPDTYIPPSHRIARALEAAGIPFDGPITDWRSWEEIINAKQPDLLIVLGHTRFDEDRGEWSMQIGTESDLYVTRVFPEVVDAPPGIPGPVAFLFGCVTSSEGLEQATFAREFRQQNASVVVGTTSTVLGRQAGPVTAGLVAAVKEAAGGRPLGELLRQARAAGLAQGSVMAMALNAFGDADYRLTI